MSDVVIRKQFLQSIKKGNVKKVNYIVSIEDNTENVKELLDLVANIETKDKYGRTALWYAGAYNFNKKMVDVLLERGHITDEYGDKLVNVLRGDMKEYVLGQFEKKKELKNIVVFDRER
jgi:ankyrin repeat protein